MQPDNTLLTGLDLDQFSEEQRQKIIEKLYKQLEDRVGDKVAALVNDEQFARFESVIDEGDEEKLDEWLGINVPNYSQMVEKTLEQLKQEVAANPGSFLSN